MHRPEPGSHRHIFSNLVSLFLLLVFHPLASHNLPHVSVPSDLITSMVLSHSSLLVAMATVSWIVQCAEWACLCVHVVGVGMCVCVCVFSNIKDVLSQEIVAHRPLRDRTFWLNFKSMVSSD